MSTRTLLVALAATWALWAAVTAAADPIADPGDIGTLHRPPPPASTESADDKYLAELARWGLRVADVRAAIEGAHMACDLLAAGRTAKDVVEQGLKANPTMSSDNEIAFYNAAVVAYCPRYLKISGTIA